MREGRAANVALLPPDVLYGGSGGLVAGKRQLCVGIALPGKGPAVQRSGIVAKVRQRPGSGSGKGFGSPPAPEGQALSRIFWYISRIRAAWVPQL